MSYRIDELEEKIRQLQCALNFWLPSIPDIGEVPKEVIDRLFDDAYLLTGYEGDIVKTAEELGWISLTHAVGADGD